ncbi:MAG: class I SAM-dependent methyltransferase [Nanoarchaeota archaeon]|nr:class I SAM-dependent methyltransferase [Nanoarchaeota archaeon]MBU1029700.1 class I SAM-dependent methyltransferase [Nanoarchaeota archaeon]MBU1849610.1 class I SAM-dependent methyltransferase [Nanoarchaeota archaeon]
MNRKQKQVNSWYKIMSLFYDFSMNSEIPPDARPIFFNKLNIQESEKGIELCSGTGLNIPFYPKSNRMYCVDINSTMMKKARKKANTLSYTNIDFVLSDAKELVFKNDSFDFGIFSYALSGTPDNELALSEMERVVKPGGRIGILDYDDSFRFPMCGLAKLNLHQLVNDRKNTSVIYHKPLATKTNRYSIYILKVTK